MASCAGLRGQGMQGVLGILFPSLPGLLARPIEVHDTLHIPVGLGPDTSRWFPALHAVQWIRASEVH